MKQHLTIGQVAKQVGIPPKTIRYYEEIKLIEPAKRLDNKYREYSKEDIARLRLVKQARALGLPLHEVKQLVQECLGGSCEHLKTSFLTQLPKYVTSVRSRIIELQELQKQLESLGQNLTTMKLSHPQRRVAEKDCCEVLEEIESITKKGGDKNDRSKTKS